MWGIIKQYHCVTILDHVHNLIRYCLGNAGLQIHAFGKTKIPQQTFLVHLNTRAGWQMLGHLQLVVVQVVNKKATENK